MKKLFIVLFMGLLATQVSARELTCRDQNNFMHGWYEMKLEIDQNRLFGELEMMSSKGREVIQYLSAESVYRGIYKSDDLYLKLKITEKRIRVGLVSYAFDRPLELNFNCSRPKETILLSKWGTEGFKRFFDKINIPVTYNNGGFREVRAEKRGQNHSGSIKIRMMKLGNQVYSYQFELQKKLPQKGVLKFTQSESLYLKRIFGEGDTKFPGTDSVLNCSQRCKLSL